MYMSEHILKARDKNIRPVIIEVCKLSDFK
jgi:hypothetical protein